MTRTLYELAGQQNRLHSPFVLRTKYALAHKGLNYTSVKCGFGEIKSICEGRQSRVPVLADGEKEINDSGAIAAYLEETYPDGPSLQLDDDATKSADEIIGKIAFGAFFPFYAADVVAIVKPEDEAYFRSTRESFLGAPLEDIRAGRDAKLAESRAALEPLRDLLGDEPWINGETPGYGDYIVLAFFGWIRGVATAAPLAADDPLVAYLDRGFALYDGLVANLPGGPIAA